MNETQITNAAVPPGAVPGGHDEAYGALLRSVRIDEGPLFTTDATGLFEIFLDELPPNLRQHHNCNACRRFVEKYGGLVHLRAGRLDSAVWIPGTILPPYQDAVSSLGKVVARARVTGVFLSPERVWGTPVTGPWRHISATPVAVPFRETKLKNAGQAMAEKLEEYGMLQRSLAEFPADACRQALKLLTDGQLARSEKCIGVARWLVELHEARDGAKGRAKENVTWLAVAKAPPGFCHVRAGMIGTLLEDIQAGLPFADIKRKFDLKMNADVYRRATVAPSVRQIDVAERAVEALGIAPAFARRYATASDLEAPDAVLWRPGAAPEIKGAKAKSVGVFEKLRPAATSAAELDVPAKAITWEKFQRDVLPGAAILEYRVPLVGRFCALTAAADRDAPPILQWDYPEVRNDVSWSFPNPPARGDEWNLTPGALVPVRMIVNSPNSWRGETRFGAQGRGVFFLLEGARDVRGLPGGGLFPEHLRSELAPYRSTIDSHMNRLVVEGADHPDTVGFGIGLFAGGDWTETAAPKFTTKGAPGPAPARVHVILVVDDSGSMAAYIDAARTALSSLLAAIRAMPGQVDVSFILFGNHANLLHDRAPLSALEGVTNQMLGRSGNTALNDTLLGAIERGLTWDSRDASVFVGIVTDGEENQSRRSVREVANLVRLVNATGQWTIAYAGAGSNPRAYASAIGLAPGNVTTFEASARGFADVGSRYATSARNLAGSYAAGQRSTTSFFGAASGQRAIGTDYPVLVVTAKSGAQSSYKLDRWD